MNASCEPLQKLLSRWPLSRRLSGSATTVIRIIMATRHYTTQVGICNSRTIATHRTSAASLRTRSIAPVTWSLLPVGAWQGE
jgi:hypothetical protein